ncbi:uncharacterized protein [Procambarus clarkii]|uniref:uncharacterized protein n=1 Tax=Procambarus clarkii TaxID=6728 RepID=UPI00374374AA
MEMQRGHDKQQAAVAMDCRQREFALETTHLAQRQHDTANLPVSFNISYATKVQESDEVSPPVLVTTRAQAARPQPADSTDTAVPQDPQKLPLNLTKLEFHILRGHRTPWSAQKQGWAGLESQELYQESAADERWGWIRLGRPVDRVTHIKQEATAGPNLLAVRRGEAVLDCEVPTVPITNKTTDVLLGHENKHPAGDLSRPDIKERENLPVLGQAGSVLRNALQRLCPSCNIIVNINQHVCKCGNRLFDVKRKAQPESQAQANIKRSEKKKHIPVVHAAAELAAEIKKIQESQVKISQWQQRRMKAEISWEESRSVLFEWEVCRHAVPVEDTKCFKCMIEASIKCEDCHRLFCYHCDMKKHFLNPFHDRFSWASGYYEALPPTVTVDLNGTFTDWRRYDLYLPIFEYQVCGYSLPADAKMLYDDGYFCSSARKSNTFFSTKLLNNWHFLKRNSPGLSMKSLLIALQALCSHNGRDGCINFEAAKRTFQEWRFMQYELANVQSYNKTVCPACHTNPFAIHIDGNKKLFRYEKVGRGLRESYYSESVFAADNDVTNHLNHIELKNKVTLQEKRNAAEKLHMYNRIMEEQNVIQLEMKSYLDFYRKKLEEITQRLDDVQNKSAPPSWIIEFYRNRVNTQ